MTVLTRAQLQAELVSNITTNGQGKITGAVLYQMLNDMINSMSIGGNTANPNLRTVRQITAAGTTVIPNTGTDVILNVAGTVTLTMPNVIDFINNSSQSSIVISDYGNNTETYPVTINFGTSVAVRDVCEGNTSWQLLAGTVEFFPVQLNSTQYAWYRR